LNRNASDPISELLHRSLYDHQPSRQSRGGGTSLVAITAADALATATPNADGSPPRCPICLDDLQVTDSNDWCMFPCCKQPVHMQCAKRALGDNVRCPMCRTLVP
jgi:hypothetical protein